MLLGIVAALVTSASGVPQATIRVTVVQSDGGPVADAAVRWNGESISTGGSGVATIPAAVGRVEIEVTKEGFLPGRTSVLVGDEEAREWQVMVELAPMPEREEEITVHATRTDARMQDSPTRVEVVGQDEIEEKTMMTPGDIVMMLNEMGGLRVQTTSPSLGAASVRIQGMLGRYTRFLSDGLPLFGQQGGGLGLLQIPPMDLGQVEVIKGAASAMYGAGAMGGVVNLISRRPAREPVHEILVNRSTLGATDVSAFVASQLSSHWSASVLGGGHFQERTDRDGDGWADLAGYSRGVVRPRVFWDGGDGRSLFLTGGVTAEDREGGTLPGRVLAATGEPYLEALYTRRYDFGSSFQFLAWKRYVVTGRAAASWQQHDHRFGEVRERDRHGMVFGELSIRGTSWGRHTWVAGAAAERETYRPLDVPRFAYTYTTPGIFVQDDVTVTRWLSVSASARADFQNRYGTFFSPRVAALVHGGGWTSRLSAGAGFIAPTPLTEETEAAGLARLSIPVSLVAERGRSASFDLTRRIGAVTATATVFGSRVSHPVYVQRDTRYALVNLPGPARNAGVELLSTWRKSPFSATASYVYVRSSEPGEAAGGGRVDTPLTPRQSFGVVGMWEAKSGVWRLGVECYYTGRQRLKENPYRGESAAYVVAGFLGERRIRKAWWLFLNAENLGGARQTGWNPLLRPSRGVDGRWTVDAWAPLEGRVLNGGVRVRF